MYIEITNACNLSCSFCPKHNRPVKIMSLDEFTAIVQKVKPYGDNFYLHVMGEPLSHPNFPEILSVCKSNGIKTNITTNGTLLLAQGNNILNAEVRMVSVSLHSFEANKITGSLNEYLNEIMEFCHKAALTHTIVELRLWNIDKDSIYDKNQLNCQIISYLQENLSLDFGLHAALEKNFYSFESSNSRKRNLKLIDNIYLGMAEHFEWPDISKATNNICTGFCYGLRNQIAVLSNGTVVPCCLDSNANIPLGNIYDNSLEEIFLSSRSVNLYTGFTNRKALEPLCQTCGYMKKFIKTRL